MGSPGIIIKNSHFSHIRFEPTKPQVESQQEVEAPAPVVETPIIVALAGVQDEREVLIKLAEEKGLKIDKRWKNDRIRAMLEHST